MTAILALSALYVATYSTVRLSNKVNKDNEQRAQMAQLLEARITSLQEQFIVSADRVTQEIRAMNNNLQFLADISKIKPFINDAHVQVIMQIHEDKMPIKRINETLKLGEAIPIELLELFNMTSLAPISAVKHSHLLSAIIDQDEINVRVIIPTISKTTVVMKADPFKYRAERVVAKLKL